MPQHKMCFHFSLPFQIIHQLRWTTHNAKDHHDLTVLRAKDQTGAARSSWENARKPTVLGSHCTISLGKKRESV